MQHIGCGKFGVKVIYGLDSVEGDAAASRPGQEALRPRPDRRLPQVIDRTGPPTLVIGLPQVESGIVSHQNREPGVLMW
jgi:hypothetical protein